MARTKDKLLYQWPEGHKLFKDKWQYIVQHHYGCKNAKRGPYGDYSRFTYLRQFENLVWEFGKCRIGLPPEITPGSRMGLEWLKKEA